jgi:long-chain acyl-CoA synthetase
MSLNLAEFLHRTAKKFPEKRAVICGDFHLSYGELHLMAERAAGVLRTKGLGPGDVVGMLLPNVPQFPMIYYGALYAGCTVAPLNPTLRAPEIARRLRDLDAKALWVWDKFSEEAEHAAEFIPSCKSLIVVEDGLAPQTPMRGESFLQLMYSMDVDIKIAENQSEDVAIILYTSAEPGLLSGAELTHSNMVENAEEVSARMLHFVSEDICLIALPLFHAFGQTVMMNAAVLAGSTMVLLPRFEPGKALEAIEQYGVTLFGMVPAMAQFLLGYKTNEEFDMSSVRLVPCGGAMMPVGLIDAFHKRFGVDIIEGYGLTETSPLASINILEEEKRPGSVGKTIHGCEIAIQRDDGGMAETGEAGEVLVRGHNVMKGYHKQPEATIRAMANGWFHTGDLGYLDADGYLYLTGLKKDLIICSGMNVFPWEVEQRLEEHPAVSEAAVVGVPDEARGSTVKAFVVCSQANLPSERELIVFFREGMASYKSPRIFEFVQSLPRDEQGRLQKDRLPS